MQWYHQRSASRFALSKKKKETKNRAKLSPYQHCFTTPQYKVDSLCVFARPPYRLDGKRALKQVLKQAHHSAFNFLPQLSRPYLVVALWTLLGQELEVLRLLLHFSLWQDAFTVVVSCIHAPEKVRGITKIFTSHFQAALERHDLNAGLCKVSLSFYPSFSPFHSQFLPHCLFQYSFCLRKVLLFLHLCNHCLCSFFLSSLRKHSQLASMHAHPSLCL